MSKKKTNTTIEDNIKETSNFEDVYSDEIDESIEDLIIVKKPVETEQVKEEMNDNQEEGKCIERYLDVSKEYGLSSEIVNKRTEDGLLPIITVSRQLPI